jgi:hypothetical protein
MSDIVERLKNGSVRYAAETEMEAGARRHRDRQDAIAEIERLRGALRDMKASRDAWQQRCADAEQQIYRTERSAEADPALCPTLSQEIRAEPVQTGGGNAQAAE